MKDPPPQGDSLASFGQAILALRWSTTAICLALASSDIQDGDVATAGATLVVVVYTVLRTIRPIRFRAELAGSLAVVAEAAIAVGAVTTTGYWESPLVFSLLTAVAVAGFARGYRFGALVAAASLVAVSAPWTFEGAYETDDLRTSAEWSGEVLLVALVAGYARRISGEADERRVQAMDRLGRLSDANVLLFQLHQVTQSLPASADLTEVLDASMTQLRELFDADVVAIALVEEADGAWHLARRHGTAVGPDLSATALPPPLGRAVALRSTTGEPDLTGANGPGLDARSGAGLYGVLTAREATIGLIVLEHSDRDHFTDRSLELLTGFVEPAALAIDNARLFGRLRSLGADEERSRIARDLHDRTGQSLAYLAFELDRITKRSREGAPITDALDALRGDVRTVIGEVRDTLYDLRTDVTEGDGLASTLRSFLDRVRERSNLEIDVHTEEPERLPLRRERELWHIAREAVTSVERKAEAKRLEVRWRCDGQSAELEVVDDGRVDADGAGGLSSQSVASLRERAASIGATLAVVAQPGEGTRVRCSLVER
ncbi:MAG: histidine kinase [Acidimicrobiales bacterium]|nr:histidine kinase [Acidimicrobiales bacterium]